MTLGERSTSRSRANAPAPSCKSISGRSRRPRALKLSI